MDLTLNGIMLPKGLIAFSVFAALVALPTYSSRAQWVQTNGHGSCLAASGPSLFAAYMDSGAYFSTDSGMTWRRSCWTPSYDIDLRVQAIAALGTNVLVGTELETYRSTNGGLSWSVIGIGVGNIGAFAVMGTTLLAGTNDDGLSGDGIFLSGDRGDNWTEVSRPVFYRVVVTTFAADDTSLYVAGIFYRSGRDPSGFAWIYRSADGVDWRSVSSDTTVPPFVEALAVCGSSVFAGCYHTTYNSLAAGGVFRSTDGGNWTACGLKGLSVYSLAVSGTNLFAGTDSGVYLSTDNGIGWAAENTGLPDGEVGPLLVSGKYLFAGAGFIYRRPLSEMIGPAAVSQPPAMKLELRSYPNPFSQSTTITFTPESSGYADVSVVNLLGVEVARIFSGELAAGERNFVWNPAGLPDGMYECLVRMNGRVEKLPIMLMR